MASMEMMMVMAMRAVMVLMAMKPRMGTLAAKDLSPPLPLAEGLYGRNGHSCRDDEMKWLKPNQVIDKVYFNKMTHIRKRPTSYNWIPSVIKESVLTSSTSCNLLFHSPHIRLRVPSVDGQCTLG